MVIVRSLLFHIYFWFVTIIMNLAFVPGLAMSRMVTLRGQTMWAKLVLFGMRWICGTRLEVRGQAIPVGGRVIVASKHQSAWDTIVTHTLFDDPAVVIKKELMKIPIYGHYCRKSGMIAVDRHAGASALKALIAEARDRLDQNRPLIIYPEGTRVVPGAVPDYKPGIAAIYAQLNCPCIPVALNSGLYWPGTSGLRFPGPIVVEFLDVIEPGLPRKEFMKRLESTIETATNRLIMEARPQMSGRQVTLITGTEQPKCE